MYSKKKASITPPTNPTNIDKTMFKNFLGLTGCEGKTACSTMRTLLILAFEGIKEDASALNPKMDRTIKKASIGIQRHSMPFGGEEKVKWVRNSYLMMGMAHFYKHDYTSARRVFDYVSKEYESTPISYEAILWLARTYIQTERYEKAEAALNLLQSKLKEKGDIIEDEAYATFTHGT